MEVIYLGVDVAGAKNMWVCGLSPNTKGLKIIMPPARYTLDGIIRFAEQNKVVAVAIDAQLTYSISEENGFRSSDMELRKLLPAKHQTWVASQNSIMAVPVRGRQLAEALSPLVGTIIETHPRACLLLANPDNESEVVAYKKPDGLGNFKPLWDWWTRHFNIEGDMPEPSDGALDSLVCATVAYLYHHCPEKLVRLHHDAPFKMGRGPFYILSS